MRETRRLLAAAAILAVAACDPQHPGAPSSITDPRLQRSLIEAQDGGASASGAGQYDINGLIVTFTLEAEATHDGKAKGAFTIFTDEGDGLTIDVDAKVTCLSIDPVNHRAWIGGRVKDNRSTDPDVLTKIHRPGHDIWFRVLDEPSGDRSTFVGFEGAAGFITSADYCAGQPWPDANARTWPVVSGGITLQP